MKRQNKSTTKSLIMSNFVGVYTPSDRDRSRMAETRGSVNDSPAVD